MRDDLPTAGLARDQRDFVLHQRLEGRDAIAGVRRDADHAVADRRIHVLQAARSPLRIPEQVVLVDDDSHRDIVGLRHQEKAVDESHLQGWPDDCRDQDGLVDIGRQEMQLVLLPRALADDVIAPGSTSVITPWPG